MKPSLLALGRFDENRVRSRFIDTFVPDDTFKMVEEGELLGFYVVRSKPDHVLLDHLYIKPEYQNRQLGKAVIDTVLDQANVSNLPVRLGALKGSRANDFYVKNGFTQTHEDEFDIYYEYLPN